MSFSVKNWQNNSGGGTKLNAVALKDLESRLAAYADGLIDGLDVLTSGEVEALIAAAVKPLLGVARTPEEFGAKGDIKYVMDAGITNGQKVLSSATADFTSDDVGKTVMIRGAGDFTKWYAYTSTIASVTNSTTAVMTANAENTVSGALAIWGTDDTAAFKEAIKTLIEEGQASGSNAGELIISGRYMIAGAPTLGGATKGNAQIPIPIVNSLLTKFRLTLQCAGVGAPLYHWNQIHPQIAGATLVSSLVQHEPDGTYHAASVIGGPSQMGTDPNGGDGFTNILLGLKGSLQVLTHRGPKHIACDFRQLAQCDLEHISAMTIAAPAEMWTDVTSNEFPGFANGVRMPEFFNNDLSRATSISVEGYSFGVVTGDHCHIDRLATIYCNYCLYTNPGGVQHGLSIGNWSTEYSRHVLLCEGQSGAKYPVYIERCDVEELQDTMFLDTENALRGVINYAEQASAAPTKTGCEHLHITDNNNS